MFYKLMFISLCFIVMLSEHLTLTGSVFVVLQGPWDHQGLQVLLDLRVRLEDKASLDPPVEYLSDLLI